MKILGNSITKDSRKILNKRKLTEYHEPYSWGLNGLWKCPSRAFFV